MPNHQNTTALDRFVGINNRLRPERTPPEFLKEAVNVDIDKSGSVKSRRGYELVESGNFSCLWSEGNLCFAVKDGSLVRILPNLQILDLSTPINSSIRFYHVDGVVYFIGPYDRGRIVGNQVLSWGIEAPNPSPNLFAASGTLSAGLYQVSLAYVDSTGLESGSKLAGQITLTGSSGILLTDIPSSSDSNITNVRIYISTADGEVLYLAKEVLNGTTSASVTSVSSAVLPLESFNYVPPPKGQVLSHFNGRMLVGQDNVLWYSEPFSHHWFNLHTNYLTFPERIRAIMPVENGIWVAADRLYFLSGEDITTCRRDLKESVVAVEGTEAIIPGHYVIIENTPIGYKWLITTDRGVFICFNQGVVLNTVESNYLMDKADVGSGSFVQEDGIAKYVPIIKKKSDSETAAVGDLVVGTIIRNGVILEED